MSKKKKPEALLLSELQLLFAQKAAYYTVFRVGLAIITLSITIIAFLLATSELHGIFDRFWLASVVLVGLFSVSASGVFLTLQSRGKINKLTKFIESIEKEDKRIAKIVV